MTVVIASRDVSKKSMYIYIYWITLALEGLI